MPAVDRKEVAGDTAFPVAPIPGLGDGMTRDAMGGIRRCVEEVLDNPGPEDEIEGGTGDLVMLPCSR